MKTLGEIELIRKAVNASVEAHLAAMKAIKPGMWEYQVAALMKYEFERRGCEWPAYPPIVGSGFFSTILHYDDDTNQLQDGDVALMDVAGSYSGYASDITARYLSTATSRRASTRFTISCWALRTPPSRLQSLELSSAPAGRRPEPDCLRLHQYAWQGSHGQPLGQYFIHGVSHSVGLNVHDPLDYNRALEPGMVITVEPGIYLPKRRSA